MVRKPSSPASISYMYDIDFGMSRMYEMLAGEEGFRTMVVRTRAEAERWVEEQLQTHLTR